MTLLRNIAAGAAWSTGAQWLAQLSQFAVSIVLARVLLPSDYGLAGMALVITGFVAIFGNLGLGAALIQKKEIDQEYISTAFWATVAAGLILLAIVYVVAPLVAEFYDDLRVTSIARVAALGLLFGPMNSIVTSILERHMRYRVVAMLDVSAALLGQATAVIFALFGMGVWSLVAGTLVSQVSRIPLAFLFERWIPEFRFKLAKLRDLLSFGGYLLAFNFVNYFNRNLDKLIIGRVLGASQLGYYDMAYQAMLKPLQNVSDTIGRPLFPALASLQDDQLQAAEIYRTVVVYISLLTFPAMFGLSAVAPEFVSVVLGDQWSQSVPVLQILALVGAIQSVASTVGSVYLSQGRSDLMLKVGIVALAVVASAFLIGVQWGIVGVASCYSLASLVVWVTSQSVANHLIGLSSKKFWVSLIPAFRSSFVMVGCVLLAKQTAVNAGFGPATQLALGVTVGVISYVGLVCIDRSPLVRGVRNAIVGRIGFGRRWPGVSPARSFRITNTLTRHRIATAIATRFTRMVVNAGYRVFGIEFVSGAMSWLPRPLMIETLRRYGAKIGCNLSHKDGWLIDNATDGYQNLVVGDNCYIGKGVFFDLPKQIVLEDEVVISGRVTLLTHADCGERAMSRWYPRVEGPVRIGRGSWVGAGATILPGVILGECCVVAAGAVVRDSWPDRSVIAGVPATLVKQLPEKAVDNVETRFT